MRFIVYGAGGIGSVIGGHLHRIGCDVVLIGSERHVEKIRESGLRLLTPHETYTLDIPAFKRADELKPFGDKDVVILTAKSQHTSICLGQLKNSGADRSTPIFCAQNSIINEPSATRVFDNVYGVMLNIPAVYLQYGEVVHPITGNGGFLEVGKYPSGSDELTYKITSILSEAGFACQVNDHIMKTKAAKTLLNLNNSLEAITDGRGDATAYVRAMRKEAEIVWRLAGIECEEFHEFERRVKALRGTNKMPEGYGADRKRGSSWQSLTRGTGNIEAEALNGDVVKLGRALGVETPYNEVLWRVAEEMAKRGEKPGRYTVDELTNMATNFNM